MERRKALAYDASPVHSLLLRSPECYDEGHTTAKSELLRPWFAVFITTAPCWSRRLGLSGLGDTPTLVLRQGPSVARGNIGFNNGAWRG